MKLLGIDYGKKYVGLAYSEGIYASGLATVFAKELTNKITRLSTELGIERIVIGRLPGHLAIEIEQVGKRLAQDLRVEVIFYDETLSTHSAQSLLQETSFSRKNRKKHEHEAAAVLMLQSYIDEQEKLIKVAS